MCHAREVLDTIVVGAGAMGSATAWQLARRGRSVALIEQFGPGHDRGSSHGATRIFRVAYRDPTYVRLAVQALAAWRELEADTGEHLLEQTGQLDHGVPAAIDEIAGHLEAAGFGAERLSPDAAQERWPGMRFDRSVVHSPDGGRVFADRTVAALQRRSSELGVDVAFHEPVEAIVELDSGVEVRTARRTLRAHTVVVAAGPWARQVTPPSIELPELTVTVETPVHFAPSDPAARWPSFLHHLDDGASALDFGAYGLESPDEGVKVGVDHAPEIDTVVRYVERWHPGLVPRPLSWAECRFTSTPDEHFVLERHGPVVVCSPCSGHGFKFTPAIGALAADLSDGLPPRYRFGRRAGGT